tara:strand:- start:14698 stop:16086 length:1389 start_codon:yes stop_codon:yes gene_type:complete
MSATVERQREVLQVNPVNLGTGVFSDRNGFNQIIFELPRKAVIADGKTLRISGRFAVKDGNDAFPENDGNFYGNALVQSDPPSNDFYIDGRTGVHSCIETLSIQNLEGATYSTIKQYNRLMSSVLPLEKSILDYQNGGVDIDHGGQAKDVTTALKCDNFIHFSIPIYDGLIMGQPLDMYLLKGLRIVITLANSSYVVQNNFWRDSQSSSAKANGGAFYELDQLRLSIATETQPADVTEAIMKNENAVLEYNTYSSFYNVVSSNDANVSININTGRTLGVIGNMVPSSWINNYDYPSQATMPPLYESGNRYDYKFDQQGQTFFKGGLRLPLDFVVDSEESQKEDNSDAMRVKTALNAITKEWSMDKLIQSLKTELSNPPATNEQARFTRDRQEITEEDKKSQYNIGVGYDWITENGSNFKNQPFGLQYKFSVGDQSLAPHSLYLFVKHKNTLVFQNGAVQVLM